MSPCSTPAASTSPPATTLVVQDSVSTGSNAKAAAVVVSFAVEAGIKSRVLVQPIQLLAIQRADADPKLRMAQLRIGQNRINPLAKRPFAPQPRGSPSDVPLARVCAASPAGAARIPARTTARIRRKIFIPGV